MLPILVLLFCLTSLLVAACAAAPAAAPTQPAPDEPTFTPGEVTLLDVRGRPAPLAGGAGAVYLTVVNGLEHDIRLTALSSPIATSAEMHETANDNGVMRMNHHPNGFAIPAQQSLKLEPGGKHIMLIDLAAPLAVGDEFPLTLQFDSGQVMSVTVPVMEIVPGMGAGQNDAAAP